MRVIFGIFLVFVGVLLLLATFLDFLTFSFFERIFYNLNLFWPLILITVGVYFLYLGLKKRWLYFLSVGVFTAFLVLLLVWPYGSTLERSQVFTGVEKILFKSGGIAVKFSEGEEFRVSTSYGVEVSKAGPNLIVKGQSWRRLELNVVEIELPKDTLELSLENGVFKLKGEFEENRFTRIEARNCVLNVNFDFQKVTVPLYFEAEDCVLETLFKLPNGTSYFAEKSKGLLLKTIEGNLIESDLNPRLFFKLNDGVFHIRLEGGI
ncbi:hypothetical protein [Thermotoga sp. SG1]|uniref:hypothetical protein n=1 Tax=Thermotoga sp. SG1 TaxID=126739 RepID=UPI000C760C59|nr:hypothetical protein [Thermotoga sp. SG1]PLV56185.1 hypothetical protein AS006_06400 [Thermotoga sp. SG1]